MHLINLLLKYVNGFFVVFACLITLISAELVNAELYIPDQSEWEDRGIVIKQGTKKSWDLRLSGMISPCTVIKKDGKYFLYYVGADGDRSTDRGPRHRALGVATSNDGVNFNKYKDNPILTYLPNNNEEEGIFSAAGILDGNGKIMMYYGAMDAGNSKSTTVDSDLRLAVSSNGYKFADLGDVLSHANIFVWGRGDELFPVGAFKSEQKTYVYYIAKGIGAMWDLGIAAWPSLGFFRKTKSVLSSGGYIIGGGDPVQISNNKIALFILRDFKKRLIEVRVANVSSPWILSDPVKIYDFSSKVRHQTVFYDNEKKIWFMYYLDKKGESIRVMTAP